MRTKDYRRFEERMKDLRRRNLYRNRCLKGRYEISSKEDKSITYREVWDINLVSHWGYVTIHPDKLTNDIGHWQEPPKTKYYGSKGYLRKKKTLTERKISDKIKSDMKDSDYDI